jgi:hypothetical protein
MEGVKAMTLELEKEPGQRALRGIDSHWAVWFGTGALIAVAGAEANAAVVTSDLNTTVSSDGTASYTINLPAVGFIGDDDPFLKVLADTTNGLRATKYSTGGPPAFESVLFTATEGNANPAPGDPALDITAFAAGNLISETSPQYQTQFTTFDTDQYFRLLSADGLTGQFPVTGEVQYVGFKVQDVGESDWFYGYIGFKSLSTGATVSGLITTVALESQANLPITAGAVPEPSSLGLLALGAVGLSTYRRRRA